MKGYIHKGVIKANGLVNSSESITDPSKLKVHSSDNGLKLVSPEAGNFEWWYFDIIDSKTGCILKFVAHLGTDPLRRRFFPQLAVTVKTPNKNESLIRHYSLKDFKASTEHCDVKLGNNFHVFTKSSDEDTVYHLSVNIDEFKADITLTGEIEGWKPLGDKVDMETKRKKGSFYWIVPMPGAKAVGDFSFGDEKYELTEAVGYHDHNYWRVNSKRKLFVDDVILKWYWGRFLSKDHSIVFMKIFLRKHSIRSLMIARENKIIHSSNNLIDISEDQLKMDEEIGAFFPSRITVKSTEEDTLLQMTLDSKEIIEKRDLLEGVNPIIRWLIRLLVSKPAYYGILADTSVNLGDKEIKGLSMYELMNFRST